MEQQTSQSNPAAEYWLAEDVFCTDLGDGAILLDLRGNRYLALTGEDARLLRSCVLNWPQGSGRALGELNAGASRAVVGLFEQKLLSRTPPPDAPEAAYIRGEESAVELIDAARIRPGRPLPRWLAFWTACLSGYLHLRLGSVRAALLHLRRQRSLRAVSSAQVSDGELLEIMADYQSMRAYAYTARERCLFDSIVMAEFLVRAGIEFTLIIGVKTRPFGAHCWVQRGTLVLNDTVEHAGAYVPIMIL